MNSWSLGGSFTYILYRVGDRTEPYGTPACISLGVDILPSTETLNFLYERKELISWINLAALRGGRQQNQQIPRAGLGSSLYSSGADPTENPSLNNTSIVGCCLGNVFTEPLPSSECSFS
jgi:hypothetical protein